jgi:Zinc knuckle
VVEPMINGSLKPPYPMIESMLQAAEKLYLELASTNAWTGLRTKGSPSGFVANQNPPRTNFCLNCGQEGHMLKECTCPINQDAMNKRRKAFKEQNRRYERLKKIRRTTMAITVTRRNHPSPKVGTTSAT